MPKCPGFWNVQIWSDLKEIYYDESDIIISVITAIDERILLSRRGSCIF